MLLFIIAVVVIFIGFALLVSRREARRHDTSTGGEFIGICKSAIESASQKEARKESVLALLRERSAFGETRELSNAEIRRALGVSGRTVVRYLNELEKEGKVEQVGIAGHAVAYRLK